MRVKTVIIPRESSYRALHDAVTTLKHLRYSSRPVFEACLASSKELDELAFKGPLQFKFFLQKE